MRNSLTLREDEVNSLLSEAVPHVIRIKMPENETLTFTDIIRGEVHFNSSLVDDKVLLKADGMPTYHLAVVVDDFSTENNTRFQGRRVVAQFSRKLFTLEIFGVEKDMPEWAHLPLI